MPRYVPLTARLIILNENEGLLGNRASIRPPNSTLDYFK